MRKRRGPQARAFSVRYTIPTMPAHAFRKDPWWHIFGLCSGLAFACMLVVARFYPARFSPIDTTFQTLVKPLQTFGHAEPFLFISVLGSGIGVTTLAFGAAYFLRRKLHTVLQLVLLLVFAALSMGIAKAFVERARPHALDWLVTLQSYSFPSGHATLGSAFFGFIAVMLYRRSRTALARFLSVLLPMLIVFLICMSRIVLGYHYFTDVAAGVLLGLFWLSVIFMLPKPRSFRQARI